MTELPRRKPIRLKKYDYSRNGLYFVTVCVKDRHEILWKPAVDVGATFGRPLSEYRLKFEYQPEFPKSILTEYGLIIDNEINNIQNHYDNCVFVDNYVIMPNHIHIVIRLINGDVCGYGHLCCGNGRPKVAPTISRVIQQFKGAVTKKAGFKMWQKSFHDRIIRNQREYESISKYIYENPAEWEEDCYFKEKKCNEV
ncbi:MAG: transposase [Oscillospiraceae bacterium]